MKTPSRKRRPYYGAALKAEFIRRIEKAIKTDCTCLVRLPGEDIKRLCYAIEATIGSSGSSKGLD